MQRHALIPEYMRDAKQGGDSEIYAELPEFLRNKNEEYYQATDIYWPQWRSPVSVWNFEQNCTAETLILKNKFQYNISAERQALVQELFTKRDEAVADVKSSGQTRYRFREAPAEIANFLHIHLEQILAAVAKMRQIMVKQGLNPQRVLEAEFRRPFDDLHNLCLQDYWETDEQLQPGTKMTPAKAEMVKAPDIRITTLYVRCMAGDECAYVFRQG